LYEKLTPIVALTLKPSTLVGLNERGTIDASRLNDLEQLGLQGEYIDKKEPKEEDVSVPSGGLHLNTVQTSENGLKYSTFASVIISFEMVKSLSKLDLSKVETEFKLDDLDLSLIQDLDGFSGTLLIESVSNKLNNNFDVDLSKAALHLYNSDLAMGALIKLNWMSITVFGPEVLEMLVENNVYPQSGTKLILNLSSSDKEVFDFLKSQPKYRRYITRYCEVKYSN